MLKIVPALFGASFEAALEIYSNARQIARGLTHSAQKAAAELKGAENLVYTTGIRIKPMSTQMAQEIIDLQPEDDLREKYERLRKLNEPSPYLVAKIDEAFAVLREK